MVAKMPATCECPGPSVGGSCSSPLVSLVILSCHRPAFLRLALRAAAMQDYPGPLEAIVVDDSPSPVALPPPAGERHRRVATRLVRLPSRHSIGAKRNAALARARGAVILHFDDDDMHPPSATRAHTQ